MLCLAPFYDQINREWVDSEFVPLKSGDRLDIRADGQRVHDAADGSGGGGDHGVGGGGSSDGSDGNVWQGQ